MPVYRTRYHSRDTIYNSMPTSIRDREVRLDPVEADGEVSSDEEPSIEKVSSMPGCFVMRGRELTITVNLRKNKCSIDGAVKKKNKCKHLNDAGDVVGLPRVDEDKTYVRNLSVLRKNKRSDKSKSGKSNPANMIFSLHMHLGRMKKTCRWRYMSSWPTLKFQMLMKVSMLLLKMSLKKAF